MTRRVPLAALAAVLTLSGCLAGGLRVVDGGLVDSDGWPVRDPEKIPFRCPLGTQLIDKESDSGRRVVLCNRPPSPVPRGFELVWNGSGRMVSRLILSKDGLPEERAQWFDNGRKAGEEAYVDGRLVRRQAWYENGEKRADMAFDSERNLMLVERYQPDGAIEARGQTRDGRRVGQWTEWRDGALEEVEFIDGVQQGKAVRSYPNGEVEQGQYENGRREDKWVRFDARGQVMREVTYANGLEEGKYRFYHPNQQLREEGRLSNGKKLGVWQAWYPSGELETEQFFVCDVLWGPTKTYYASGNIHTEGVFERGRKIGEWKVYSESGVATKIETNAVATETWSPSRVPQACDAD